MDDVDRSLSSLSDALWEIRELLDICDYLLLVQRLVSESGHIRWLGMSAQQLDTVCTQLRRTEVVRAGHADHAARLLGLPHDAPLGGIATAAPEPWAGILADHVTALRELSVSVAAGRRAAEGSLRVGAAAVEAALEALSGRGPDDPRVGVPRDELAGRRLDRQA